MSEKGQQDHKRSHSSVLESWLETQHGWQSPTVTVDHKGVQSVPAVLRLLIIFSEWCQWLITDVMSGYWTITSQKYDVYKEMPKPDTEVFGPADGTGRTKHE